MAKSSLIQVDSSAKMLSTLRIKFILINMLLAILVIASSFGVVCYVDYTTRLNEVYTELEAVLDDLKSPRVPQIASTQPLVKSDEAGNSATDNSASSSYSGTTWPMRPLNSSSNDSDSAAPTIGTQRSIILVAVYSVAPSGIYTKLTDYTNAAIPESVILNANDYALKHDTNRGYIDQYDLYFEKVKSIETPGNYLIAYADGSSVKEWQSLAITLLFVGLVALAVFFLINIFFSKWALRPVEVSLKQQQQFTADASHELKTPLTVILANMAILKAQGPSSVDSQMQWIDSTEKEAERMQLLVNDMLALSRPEEQKRDLMKTVVDFSDLVEGEVLQFESVAFELGVEINDHIEEGLTVEGDPERLGRMVATLIDNACKYAGLNEDDKTSENRTEEVGGPETDAAESTHAASSIAHEDILLGTDDDEDNLAMLLGDGYDSVDIDQPLMPEVRVTLQKKTLPGMLTNMAELKVHNSGPAIPEEDLPFIFHRFYRADKVRTSSKGGYGLGLAIGQDIAQEHNGNISVSSSESEGTTFTVTIPLLA